MHGEDFGTRGGGQAEVHVVDDIVTTVEHQASRPAEDVRRVGKETARNLGRSLERRTEGPDLYRVHVPSCSELGGRPLGELAVLDLLAHGVAGCQCDQGQPVTHWPVVSLEDGRPRRSTLIMRHELEGATAVGDRG